MVKISKNITRKCVWCGSNDTYFDQDIHNKTTQDGADYGVLVCNNCHQIQFWFFKIKGTVINHKQKIEIKYKEPNLVFINQWDGPVTQFLWSHIERSSKLTGRPTESYYSTIIIKNSKEMFTRRLDFTEVIDMWNKKVLAEIREDSQSLNKIK
jgi:hypothetical protein